MWFFGVSVVFQWCFSGVSTTPLTLIKLHRSTEFRPFIRIDF